MGTLSTIGVLDSGQLSTVTAEKFKEAVVNTLKNGFNAGNINIPAGAIDLIDFQTGPIEEIKQKYPAWNAYYVEGLLTNIVKSLDTIPDTGVAFPIVFDPTRPIALILAELSALFEPINLFLKIPIIDIVLGNINIFLLKAPEIAAKLQEVIDAISDSIEAALEKAASFFELIKSAIGEALQAAGEAVETVITQLDAIKETIIQKIVEIAEKIKNAALSLVPEFSLPTLDISFLDPKINLSPLFATVELNGIDGLVTKFTKLMLVFLKIPGEIIKTVADVVTGVANAASELVIKISNAIKKIFTNITEAIKDMLDALLGFIWEKITSIVNINPSALLEVASTFTVVTFFTKLFIISLIGFILGSGLITLTAGKVLEII